MRLSRRVGMVGLQLYKWGGMDLLRVGNSLSTRRDSVNLTESVKRNVRSSSPNVNRNVTMASCLVGGTHCAHQATTDFGDGALARSLSIENAETRL